MAKTSTTPKIQPIEYDYSNNELLSIISLSVSLASGRPSSENLVICFMDDGKMVVGSGDMSIVLTVSAKELRKISEAAAEAALKVGSK